MTNAYVIYGSAYLKNFLLKSTKKPGKTRVAKSILRSIPLTPKID